VLDQDSKNLQSLDSLLNQLKCSVVVTRSVDQAMAKASQIPPYLIILTGGQQSWTKTLVRKLRNVANSSDCITIVAVTDVPASSWLSWEENPGLDGFLVNPLNSDILTSLVQSAWVRQTYCSPVVKTEPMQI
jgi:response regulator RpfG family c-di-GMP phosphodiesterase